MRKMIGKCPVCDSTEFEINRITCTGCGTAVEGHFSVSKLGGLSDENQNFVLTFLKCRGNIKDVERELGISYPTVRARLDRVIEALGFAETDEPRHRKDILEALEKKEITPEEAVRALKGII